ncbi:MAG: hypothetical protein WAM17_02895, partial [Rhodoplanes sp.]
AIEDSETRQADFDAAAAEVEALDKEIANAERLQKLRGEKARGTPESEGLDSVIALHIRGLSVNHDLATSLLNTKKLVNIVVRLLADFLARPQGH